MKFTVQQGKRYKACVRLGLFEQVVSNGTLKEKLEGIGFSDVTVSGEGRERWAFGRWFGADTSAEIPEQVTNVVEI